MAIEMRQVDDHVVLYTDEAAVYERLRHWPGLRRRVGYRKNGRHVGFDFYFDWRVKDVVLSIARGQLPLPLE